MSEPAFRVSVIVPTYARPDRLRNCLGCLSLQDYPSSQFEVIVVDDGSWQALDPLIEPFCDSMNIRLLRKTNGGPGSARNIGAGSARGAILAFTDDDCCPSPRWLCSLVALFDQDFKRMVGGRVVNSLDQNPYAATSQLILDAVYAFYNQDADAPRFFASNNMAVPTVLFHELGGFDLNFKLAGGEDRDFCDRWLHHGYKSAYAPEAVVFHAHALGFRSFCRQHFNYGRGAWRYHRLRARRRSGSLIADLKFHTSLARLLREPLFRLHRSVVPSVICLLVVWQIANAAGFFYEQFSTGNQTRRRQTNENS
jgi:GT2 family glycosyltransferase